VHVTGVDHDGVIAVEKAEVSQWQEIKNRDEAFGTR
jgi:hypothetical protein